jgi:hypothetical protein
MIFGINVAIFSKRTFMPRTLLFFILFVCPRYAFSQEDTIDHSLKQPTHILSVSYGTLTTDYLLDGYKPGRPTTRDYTNKAPSAVLNVGYKFRCSDLWYVGITASVEQEHGDWLDNEIYDGNVFDLVTTVKGAFIRTNFTFGADFTRYYMVSDIVRIYTTGGIGVTYEFETDQYNPAFYDQGYWQGVNNYGPIKQTKNRAHINAFYSPVGISIGSKLRYFLEAGFGYKGVINTGITYGFNNKAIQP